MSKVDYRLRLARPLKAAAVVLGAAVLCGATVLTIGETEEGAVRLRSPGASVARMASPGRTVVVVGVTPALRVRSRTSLT